MDYRQLDALQVDAHRQKGGNADDGWEVDKRRIDKTDTLWTDDRRWIDAL